jgi:hypothetical protein
MPFLSKLPLGAIGRLHGTSFPAVEVCHIVAIAHIPVVFRGKDVAAVMALRRLGASEHTIVALVTDLIAAIDASFVRA